METTTPKTGYSGAVSGTGTMGSTEKLKADQAAERAHSTVDHVAQGAHDTVERIAAKAEDAFESARSVGSDAQTTAYAKYQDFVKGEWAESMREEVRARPLAVVGIALVAGLLIGRLI
jgi:ElaB/YqjD/DUF883 family membrane-anchored ribosome-binding protein